MKKLPFVLTAVGILLLVLIRPFVHLLSTYIGEHDEITIESRHLANDESHLNATYVDSILQVAPTKEALITQLQEILKHAEHTGKKISIAGAKHSMGGHTIYPNGIQIDMSSYKHMSLDSTTKILTIGSGALWSDALLYLDTKNKSIAVMQAFSNFSIGGSLSVNGHGWQHNAPPVSYSVVSFDLMLANGTIVTCDRNQNSELFKSTIGGYGLLGILLDVRLRVVDNQTLTFQSYKLPTKDYLSYYESYVDAAPYAQLAFGRLKISKDDFLNEATLNIFSSIAPQPKEHEKLSSTKSNELKRLIFRSSVDSEYGKRLRWNLESNLLEPLSKKSYTRNQLLDDDVSLIQNKDTTRTDILHEYFIPRRNVNAYIEELKKVLPSKEIDLLNITIRNVYKDNDSYLSYANEEVFGFVLLFNQRRDGSDETPMKELTEQLVELTLQMDGTYYLPYRLHVAPKTFQKVYPNHTKFYAAKLKYDPKEIFQNKFYLHYFKN